MFGDGRLNTDGRPGGRFTIGYWLDGYGLGIENTFLFLDELGQSFFASSGGNPILARPFFNTQTSAQDALLLAYPDIVVGSINVASDSAVYANELNLRRALYADACVRFDVLAGYRYFYLGEGLTIDTTSTSVDGGTVPAGTGFRVQDNFQTRNHFNGGQIGLKLQQTRCQWTLDLLAKLAIGGVSQRVAINGSTVVTVPGEAPVTNVGGVLALPSNIGNHETTKFGVLPEFGINVGYQLNPCWKLNFGYTVMVLTNVVRPGDQIDLQLDPAQFPPGEPGTFPAFAFHESDVWLQGLNLGMEYNY